MTRQTLYSCKAEIDIHLGSRYRISKFVDGELESSYLTTFDACDCPAGVRPSCRHRQMLPQMLAASIVNTHWFWDFDLGRPVDFSGELKSNIDAMNELAAQTAQTPDEAIEAMANCDYWNGRKSLGGHDDNDPHSTTVSAPDFDSGDTGSIPVVGASPASPPTPPPPSPTNWRRF